MRDYEVICPTRARADQIGDYTFKLMPSIKYAILHEEVDAYIDAGLSKNQIIPHDRKGITPLMAWLMETRKAHTIVRIDDDIKAVRSMVGQHHRDYHEEEDVFAIIEQGYEASKDLGISLFFWNQSGRPINCHPEKPFAFMGSTGLGGVYGVHGRKLKYDTRLTTREDLDLVLQAFLIDRFVLIDLRYYWTSTDIEMQNKGGLQLIRTSEAEGRDKETLKSKWGAYLEFDVKKPHLKRARGVKFHFSRTNQRSNVE